MKRLSLRPYNGNLFLCTTREDYERQHKRVFREPDVLSCEVEGRFVGGEGKDGLWTYLVFADTAAMAAHEFGHVIFHTFHRCRIDPRDSDGEAFCYMLSQLMKDSGY